MSSVAEVGGSRGKCVYISGWDDDMRKNVSQCCSGLKGVSLTRSFDVSPTWNGKMENEAILLDEEMLGLGRWFGSLLTR